MYITRIEYKWILSVFIPDKYKPFSNVYFERIQDTEALISIAEDLGSFPIFKSEKGIEIRGYDK